MVNCRPNWLWQQSLLRRAEKKVRLYLLRCGESAVGRQWRALKKLNLVSRSFHFLSLTLRRFPSDYNCHTPSTINAINFYWEICRVWIIKIDVQRQLSGSQKIVIYFMLADDESFLTSKNSINVPLAKFIIFRSVTTYTKVNEIVLNANHMDSMGSLRESEKLFIASWKW